MFAAGLESFNVPIGYVVFAPYFAARVAADPTAGQQQLTLTLAISGLIAALLAPPVALASEHPGRRRMLLTLFVAINAAAMDPERVESELFGEEDADGRVRKAREQQADITLAGFQGSAAIEYTIASDEVGANDWRAELDVTGGGITAHPGGMAAGVVSGGGPGAPELQGVGSGGGDRQGLQHRGFENHGAGIRF